jgi:hypothetical protein
LTAASGEVDFIANSPSFAAPGVGGAKAMELALGSRRVGFATGLALSVCMSASAFAQDARPLLPPSGAQLRDATHATDLPLNRNYVWDPAKNAWVDASTGSLAPAPSVQDPALVDKSRKAQQHIEEAIATCDRVRFDAAAAALQELDTTAAGFIKTLDSQIAQVEAHRGNSAELSRERFILEGDRHVIQAMLENDRGRFAGKCGEGKVDTQVEQPVLPPHAPPPETRQPSSLEIAVLDDINKARTDPHGYASLLRPAPYVDITDAAAFLSNHAPIAPLALDPRLASAAIAHEEDQGPKGGESHTGSDGSRPSERMRAVGVQTSEYAEVISIGYPTAPGVLQQLLVDQPGPNHPHRDDLFDPNLAVAGVGCGPSTKFGTICVIDLASRYVAAAPLVTIAIPALPSPPEEAVDLYDQLLPQLSPQQRSRIETVAEREANDAAISEDKVRSDLFDSPSSAGGVLDTPNMSIDDILFAAFMDVLNNMDKQIQSEAAQVSGADRGPAGQGPQAAELKEAVERRAKVLDITDQLFEAVNRAASALSR